jgi:hypothetical protein
MKIFRLSGLVLALTLTLFGCDKVEKPFLHTIDTGTCESPEFPEITNHVRRVLLEDYTGHACPNCPTAGKLARDLKEQHPNQVVLIAVHAGYFANVYPKPPATSPLLSYDFNTTAGTEWDKKFGNGNAGNPNGLVNRLKVNNKFVLRPNEWSGVITTALSEAPKMDLQLIVDFDAFDRKICVHTQSYFLQPLDLNLKMEVILTEDSIIAPQQNNDLSIGPEGILEDFVHMHIMRGALTDTWGSDLATAGTANPEKFIKSFQSVLPEKCVAKNCHIVAFIFDKDTYEVLQVAETKLIE